MKVRPQAPAAAASAGEGDASSASLRDVLVVVAAAVVIVVFYVSTYATHHFAVPLGWDAPGYAWRTELARAAGVSSLPSTMPPPGPLNPGRPGFVVVGGLLSAVLRVHPLRMAAVLPGVMAAATGLAAGAGVATVLGRPRWEAATVGLGVGTSMFLVRAINVEGYQDNVLALGALTAAVTPLLLAVHDRRAILPGVLLLGATGLLHWNVLEVGLAVVGLTTLIYLPRSMQLWRAEARRPIDTPSGRLLVVGAGGAALAAGGITWVLTAPLPSPRVDIGQFFGKLRRDLPTYRLPFTLGAAAVGALALAGSASGSGKGADRVRVFLAFMLAWCEVTLLAFVGQWAFGRGIAGHRVLAICLAIPILGVLGLVWLSQWAGRLWRPLTGALVVAGLGGSAFLAQAEWSSYRPVMNPELVVQGATAARYLGLARVDPARPVVFVVDSRDGDAWSDVWLAAHTLRASLPADRIQQAYVFVGTPEDYLAQRPTTLPVDQVGPPGGISGAAYNAISGAYFSRVAPTYPKHPIALILAAANRAFVQWAGGHRGSLVGPGVAVVSGPTDGRSVPAAVSSAGPWSLPGLAGAALGTLAILAVVGAGWAVGLLGPWLRFPEIAAMAPAVGAAALVMGGVVLDLAGLSLAGWQAYAVVALVAAGGWALAARVLKRSRRAGSVALQ